MTIEEIKALAEKKYAFEEGDCHLTRRFKRLAKEDFIKKLMRIHGFVEGEKVNS